MGSRIVAYLITDTNNHDKIDAYEHNLTLDQNHHKNPINHGSNLN